MSRFKLIKQVLTICGFNIESILCKRAKLKSRFGVLNVNSANFDKRCLLLYLTEPFLTETISDRHQNLWQSREIARIVGERGYIVDVFDFNNEFIESDYKYDLVIGLIPRGIESYEKLLKPGCIKVAYLTSMNLQYTSGAEVIRLGELEQRRGVRISPRRFAGFIQKKIEGFDAAWYIGNEYNFHSYDCFKMPPSFRIINSGYSFDWFNPSVSRKPHNFLFIGSLGQVHKGLDLLLEVFSTKLHSCNLYVCSCYEAEVDFCEEYREELFHTKNIYPEGFVDINSDKFREITETCAYTILPSCAEGCPGSILTAMSAGLIPIVSRECGFYDDEVINLPDCRIETLSNVILEYSQKDERWIKEKSKSAIEMVKAKYSKDCFTKSIINALDCTLKGK